MVPNVVVANIVAKEDSDQTEFQAEIDSRNNNTGKWSLSMPNETIFEASDGGLVTTAEVADTDQIGLNTLVDSFNSSAVTTSLPVMGVPDDTTVTSGADFAKRPFTHICDVSLLLIRKYISVMPH